MNKISVPENILESLEIDLRNCCQLFLELKSEDFKRITSKYILSEKSLNEFNQLKMNSFEAKQIVTENCFIAVGEYWDFKLDKDIFDRNNIEFKSFHFKFVPSEQILKIAPEFLWLNTKWNFEDRFGINKYFLNLRQGDFLKELIKDWRMGDPPPANVYSFILKIIGPK